MKCGELKMLREANLLFNPNSGNNNNNNAQEEEMKSANNGGNDGFGKRKWSIGTEAEDTIYIVH